MKQATNDDVFDLITQADAAWNLLEYEVAADLYGKAAAMESALAANRHRWGRADATISYEGRRAFCLWEAGKIDEARPTLERLTHFDWKSARLWHDRHIAGTAFTYLLLDHVATGDKGSFLSLWNEATEHFKSLEMPFPFAYPHKRMLIAACIEMNDVAGCRQILEGVDAEAMKDPELRMAVKRAERFISTGDAP